MMIRNKNTGFTIVELLIVIVIIGILAALVIIAYTGIQNRAKTTKAHTNATTLDKKLEAYYADDTLGNGVYPLLVSTVNTMGGSASLANTGIVASVAVPTSANGQTTLQYLVCDAGQGFQVKYWDYAATPPGVVTGTKIVTGGTQVSCAAPAS